MLLAFDLDLTAGILAEQDRSPAFTSGVSSLPSSVVLPLPTATTFPLGLFLGGIGNDNPAFGLFLFLDPLYQNPVSQWSDLSSVPLQPPSCWFYPP